MQSPRHDNDFEKNAEAALKAMAVFFLFTRIENNFSKPLHVGRNEEGETFFSLIEQVEGWRLYRVDDDCDDDFKINLYAKHSNGEDPMGLLHRFGKANGDILKETRADIMYPRDALNPCWARFTVTKELCHIIMATMESLFKANRNDEIAKNPAKEILETCINDNQFGSGLGGYDTTTPPGQEETLAYALAIFLLIPPFEDEEIIKMRREGSDASDIALKYRVPERRVEYRISDAGMSVSEGIKKYYEDPDTSIVGFFNE